MKQRSFFHVKIQQKTCWWSAQNMNLWTGFFLTLPDCDLDLGIMSLAQGHDIPLCLGQLPNEVWRELSKKNQHYALDKILSTNILLKVIWNTYYINQSHSSSFHYLERLRHEEWWTSRLFFVLVPCCLYNMHNSVHFYVCLMGKGFHMTNA